METVRYIPLKEEDRKTYIFKTGLSLIANLAPINTTTVAPTAGV